MPKIYQIQSLEILDSRGMPTLRTYVRLEDGSLGVASVPSGASTGTHEAVELRDADPDRFHGKGVLIAKEHVEGPIREALVGSIYEEVSEVDAQLLELDASPLKSKLGANALLSVSLAFARALAVYRKVPLFRLLGSHAFTKKLPIPMFNVLNGGVHAHNGLNIQEFMIVPHGISSFKEQLRAGAEIYQRLKILLRDRHLGTGLGDEGGFAPVLEGGHQAALELLMQAIVEQGFDPTHDVGIALDCAASEFFHSGKYCLGQEKLEVSDWIEQLSQWCHSFPIVSIEDPMAEDDIQGWALLTQALGDRVHIVGDDLFVTQTERLRMGIERSLGNAILIKPNQVGTLTETHQCIVLAKDHGYRTILSHRSGETEDSMIADLAISFEVDAVKMGAPARSERTCKYNRLLEIEAIAHQQLEPL